MRISGTEPSSVVFSQTMKCEKLTSDNPKVPKEAEAKGDGVINPQNYDFKTILKRKILMLSNAMNQTKSTVELGYMCPRRLSGPPAVTNSWNIKRDFY